MRGTELEPGRGRLLGERKGFKKVARLPGCSGVVNREGTVHRWDSGESEGKCRD